MVACVELIAYTGTHSLHIHTVILDYFGTVFSRCSILIIVTSCFKSGPINQKNKALAKSLDASHLGKSFCTSSPIWNVGWFSPQKQYSYSLEGHGGRGWCKKNPQKTKVPGECLGRKFVVILATRQRGAEKRTPLHIRFSVWFQWGALSHLTLKILTLHMICVLSFTAKWDMWSWTRLRILSPEALQNETGQNSKWCSTEY